MNPYPPYPPPPPKSGGTTWIIVLLIAVPAIVAVIGILAVFAIYGTRKYIANAKLAEARNTLGQLAKDAAEAYERDGKLCPSASSPIPAVVPHAAKYQSAPAEWEGDKSANAGFACLRFSMSSPQYFQYDYKATSAGFTVTAHGDLNGDGAVSTFEVEGHVSGSAVVIVPTIKETDPEE
jgi:type IV pilus assembly protein PilA